MDNIMNKRYFLDSDEDGHWYLVEASSRKKWEEWLRLDPEDELSWTHPSFAKAVGGSPNRIEFENPE